MSKFLKVLIEFKSLKSLGERFHNHGAANWKALLETFVVVALILFLRLIADDKWTVLLFELVHTST